MEVRLILPKPCAGAALDGVALEFFNSGASFATLVLTSTGRIPCFFGNPVAFGPER